MSPFEALRRLLDYAGRNGPIILLFGVMAGVIMPPLAEAARPLMGLAVYCFTLGAFLKVDRAAFRREAMRPALVLPLLVWSALGVPMVAVLASRMIGAGDATAQGLILAMLPPPVGSAAAVAAMLGLNAPLALFATICATVLAPLSLPVLAHWAGLPQLAIDPWAMMRALVLIVGGAAASALLLRRFAGGFVQANPQVMTGIAVAGLLVVGVAAMRGMQPLLLGDPLAVGQLFVLAFVLNIGLQALGALLFLRWGPVVALTAGLVSGNRNVTLAWAAAGMALPAPTELGLAMCVFPIFMLPALFHWLIPDPEAVCRRLRLE